MHDYKEGGSNIRRKYTIHGSFKYIAAGTTVGVIRDGKTGIVASVTRNSAGLYTVQLDTTTKYPVPLRLVTEIVRVSSSATPTKVCQAQYVTGSWDPVAKTFQIVCLVTGTVGGAAAAPVVGDPDDGSRISFKLTGALTGAGTDAA